jgi:serine/threonine protein kinase
VTISSGARLGVYEILGLIGAGGMGEVYRARDTRLGRDVAIKIVPAHLIADQERRTRLVREARLLATLNHPHIGAIYGLEESSGVTAMVLELVEGSTLADRLRRGPLSVADALAVARQIAMALDEAHERGIVHRDLKPANIVLQNLSEIGLGDVRVKVLDFGLAKPVIAGFEGDVTRDAQPFDPSAEGRISGTPAYMSPEQVRGLAVDKRTDIWAFGCVLFEMLTGRRAFEGATVTDMLAHVLERDPDWSALPVDTPATVRALLGRCLTKDRRKRLHDIADAVLDINDRPTPVDPHATAARGASWSGGRRFAWVASAALGGAILTALTLTSWRRVPDGSIERVEFSVGLPEGSRFPGTSPEFAISPDGRQLAFVATSPVGNALWIRPLSAIEPRELPGTEGARNPFWSPDSRSLGYFANNELKIVQVSGGSPISLCPAASTVNAVAPSGTWNTNGVIVFGPSPATLLHVPASGGNATPATKAESGRVHRWPSFLPDGQHFLYLALQGERGELRVGSLSSGDSVALGASDSHGGYAAGYLFFVRGGNLMAQGFDARTQATRGDLHNLGLQASIDPPWQRGMFSVSGAGRLAYSPTARYLSQLTWFDRTGATVGTLGTAGVFFNVDLSRDGRRVAVSQLTQPRGNAEFDIWVTDVATGAMTRLTDDPAWEFDPTWSPDGSQIAFNSNRANPGAGPYSLFMRASDGSGSDVPLVRGDAGISTESPDWSRAGVVTFNNSSANATNVWMLPMSGSRTAVAFLSSKHNESSATISPDGQWIAYNSDISGRDEVYVRPFPGKDPVLSVSRTGGKYARWRADGKELFFLGLDGTMMAASIDTARGSLAAAPQPLFKTPIVAGNNHPYAVTNDGQRFLIPVPRAQSLRVIMDWRALGDGWQRDSNPR